MAKWPCHRHHAALASILTGEDEGRGVGAGLRQVGKDTGGWVKEQQKKNVDEEEGVSSMSSVGSFLF